MNLEQAKAWIRQHQADTDDEAADALVSLLDLANRTIAAARQEVLECHTEIARINHSDYEFTSEDDIRDQREQLVFAEEAWLRKNGWTHTSSTPGCYWLWQRTLDDGRTVLVDREMAIKMTANVRVGACQAG